MNFPRPFDIKLLRYTTVSLYVLIQLCVYTKVTGKHKSLWVHTKFWNMTLNYRSLELDILNDTMSSINYDKRNKIIIISFYIQHCPSRGCMPCFTYKVCTIVIRESLTTRKKLVKIAFIFSPCTCLVCKWFLNRFYFKAKYVINHLHLKLSEIPVLSYFWPNTNYAQTVLLLIWG